MEAPGQRVVWERRERESDPISLARRYLDGADLVLVEGFAAQPLPKIETYRLACGQDPLYDPARPDAELWVAMITDNPRYRAAFPVFRFSDTAWLMTPAHNARGRAQGLDPPDADERHEPKKGEDTSEIPPHTKNLCRLLLLK